jgi:hypothetical protein
MQGSPWSGRGLLDLRPESTKNGDIALLQVNNSAVYPFVSPTTSDGQGERESLPSIVSLLADLHLPELNSAAMALKCNVSPARLVFRRRHPGGPGFHVREFRLVGFQDRLAVEPHRDPGAGALDLDRVPLGRRPRRVGGRAPVPIE